MMYDPNVRRRETRALCVVRRIDDVERVDRLTSRDFGDQLHLMYPLAIELLV
jgi:hypothetical protein